MNKNKKMIITLERRVSISRHTTEKVFHHIATAAGSVIFVEDPKRVEYQVRVDGQICPWDTNQMNIQYMKGAVIVLAFLNRGRRTFKGYGKMELREEICNEAKAR